MWRNRYIHLRPAIFPHLSEFYSNSIALTGLTRRGGGTQIGLITQDVAPVFPELVSTGSDGEQSLAYAQMVAPLIEAVKTLKADNDALTAELAALRRRVETLETQMNAHPR